MKVMMKKTQITELPNGIRIVSERIDSVRSFSLGFWFDVGSRDEDKANNGISHFLEHMFFKGTKKRTPKQIAEDVESLGGYLNAFTSKEHTCFYGRGLDVHIEKIFEVLADMLQYSVFKPSEIKKESSVVIDELNDIEDSPEELIFDKFETNLFPTDPLGYTIIGTEKNLKNFCQKDLFSYIKDKYKFNNFLIAASGQVKHEDLVKFAKKYITKDFGYSDYKRPQSKEAAAKNLFFKKDIQQAHIIMGRTAPGYKEKMRTKVSVLSHILGEGSSSRLFQTVREKNGIAYQINSFLNSFNDISTMGVYFSTNEKSAHKAESLILNEFKKMRSKKISTEELDRAKNFLKGNIIMSLENTTNRMIRNAQSLIYHNRIKTVDETIKEIESVTREDVLELSNQYLDYNTYKKVVISSKNLLLHSVV